MFDSCDVCLPSYAIYGSEDDLVADDYGLSLDDDQNLIVSTA